jgi:cytochrome c553
MKRNCLIALMFLATAGFAAAQPGAPTSDVLGAHLNYGRGCVACHAPHSGAFGNGYKPTADVANTGTIALWGEDVSGLLGKTLVFGQMDNGATYSTTLASSVTAALNGDPTVTGVLMCLSCHDGNFATGAMMKNTTYEKITTGTVGGNAIPTLLGADGTGAGDYLNDHPVGTNAVMGCGAPYNWDCTVTGSTVAMTGPNSTAFVKNYGYFVKPATYSTSTTTGGVTTTTTKPIVVCTTCHNQHLMNVVNVTAKNSGMTPGYYQTMFFLVGPYNPNSTTTGSNQTAQFCRQCHGGEANESNGSYVIPTTF